MNNLFEQDFRKELLRTDIVPRKLNDISQKYKDLFLKDLESGVIKTELVNKCQCGSDKLEQLTNIDRFGLPFGSLICQDCGLVSTSPRIKEESLPYYYDKYYHPLNYGKEHLENQTVLFATGQGKKIFNILKEYLPKKEKITVLEIGAGTGNVLFEFKEEAKKENILVEELGTEYSQDCINKCKENSINTIFGNIQTVVELNKKFDVIILSHVFEHFVDLSHELANLKKLMNDGCLLYIEVPGIKSIHINNHYEASFLKYLIHAHMYNFTMNSLRNTLLLNGFSMIYGNENIECIFKVMDTSHEEQNNAYFEILYYLEFLYQNKSYFIDLKLKIDQYKNRIKNRDEAIKVKKEQLATLETKIKNRDEAIKVKKEQLATLETKIKNRDETIKVIKEQLTTLETKVKNRDETIKVIKEQLTTLETKVKNRNKVIETFKKCKGGGEK